MVAFYPDGAWWVPCIMEQSTRDLRVADALGIDESFCPVRAMLGAFVNGRALSPAGPAGLQRGGDLRRLLRHRPAAGGAGLADPLVGDARTAARPNDGETAVALPGGFRAPREPGGVRARASWSVRGGPGRRWPASR